MIKEGSFSGINYLMYIPKDFDVNNKYPTVFHTHGAGSRGKDLEKLKTVGILKEAIRGELWLQNCVIVCPQCGANTWFDVFESLIALCRHIYSLDYVDGTKFYSSGISMGGYAAVQLMMSCPELFAAGIVCCGGGMYWNAGRLKEIPLRFFHGAQDKTVLPEESLHLCSRISVAGGDAKVTIYPNNDHNCWDETYSNPDVYEWLFSKKKEKGGLS